MAKKNEIRTADLPIVENIAITDYAICEKNGVTQKSKFDKLPFANKVGGKVPADQLPSAIDDVIDLIAITATPPISANTGELYYNTSTLKIYTWAGSWTNPVTPSQGKIYLPIGSTLTYRWTGTVMGIAGGNIELGETASTAFAGDKGKEAYDFTKGQVLTNLNQLDTGINGFWYTTPAVNVQIQGFNVVCVFSYGYNIDNIGLFAICEGAYFTSSKYDGTNDWQKHLTATDILGSIKKADLNTLKTDVLPSYVESPSGTYTASANGALTLDGGVTAIAGQTVFVSTLNKCFTITSAGSAGTKWVLTTLLPNSSSTNAIITTANVSSVWCYYNSTYNRVYLKSDSTTDLALKVDKVAGKALSKNDFTDAYKEKVDIDADLFLCSSLYEFKTGSLPPITQLDPESPNTWTADADGELIINGTTITENYLLFNKGGASPYYGLWNVISLGSVSEPFVLEKITHNYKIITEKGTGNIFIYNEDIFSGLKYINISEQETIKVGSGANYTSFDTNGHQTMNGDATVWDDLDFDIYPRTTGGNIPTPTTLIGNLTCPVWAVGDYHNFESKERRHNTKLAATTNQWHIHIYTNGLDTSNRYIAFTIEYTWSNLQYASANKVLQTPITISSGDLLIPANTPDRSHMIFNIGTPFGLTSEYLGAHIKCRLVRVASSGTAPTNAPFLEKVQIHYELDSIGSREITTK